MTAAARDPPAADAAERTPPTWLPLVAVGVTLVLWASAFVAIRHLAGDFSPGALSLGRLARRLALPRRRSRCQPGAAAARPGGEWVSIVTIGVLWFGVYNVALNAGEQHVDAGTAVMLIQVSPVLVALLAAIFLYERFTIYLGLGLALAFAGVALIATASGDSDGDRSVLGVVLCLVAAVVYSISLVLQKPLVARLSALHVTWLACTVGAVVCLPFAGQLVDDARDASRPTSGGSSTSASSRPRSRSRRTPTRSGTMTASSLGVTTYLVPPITIVMGWLFLDEAPPTMAYVGGALALVGVAVARRKPRTLAEEPPAPA